MSKNGDLNRRDFLRNAGLAAVVAGSGAPLEELKPADNINGKSRVTPQQVTYDFDEVYNRVGTNTVKWDDAGERHSSGLDVGMGIADMDFKAPPCIKEALLERCEHENWGYTNTPAGYVEAIVSWNQRRYGLDIDPSTLVLTTGVHPGVIAALKTFSPPGTRTLICTPSYNGFYGDLRASNTVAEDSTMTKVNGRYEIDFDDFERRAARCNCYLLCNPQNPTGNVWSEEDLLRMGEICLRHRTIVLADEIHCDFVMQGHTYTPFASLPDKDVVDNSITFKAASKTFSLPAMKAAWFFSTNEDYLNRVRDNHRADLTELGMFATMAALNEGEDWLNQVLAYIDESQEFVANYIRDNIPLIKQTKPEGTYLTWLDVSRIIDIVGAKETAAERELTSVDPYTPEMVMQEWFGQHARVDLNPGSSYGTGGDGHMRMNIAVSRRLLKLALDNIAEAVDKLPRA
ncbi:aminotransferase class I/II-fold pyridoxal phosphate-dependent enzyme [Gemmatimonadota bacterium]